MVVFSLQMAAYAGNEAVLTVLLENGAKPNIQVMIS